MKILFTGSSCFTGMWFIEELVKQGHEVLSVFQKELKSYEGLRRQRVERVAHLTTPLFNTSFGDDSFLQAIKDCSPIDLLCHHGAYVTDYKSPLFDFSYALSKNTYRIREVLSNLKEEGCQKILLTGSVFEQREGGKEAVSPYGLSKGLTSDVFSYFANFFEMTLGKFVIPNPFGPFEEPRFTSFLAKEWLQKRVPEVSKPDYIRDNIPAPLLAKAYAFFVRNLSSSFHPSGYRELQGAFVKRFSEELSKRFEMPCPFILKEQTLFEEPKERVNTDVLDMKRLGFDETKFWDSLADFYQKVYA